jgi:hypothetical protein
MIGRSLNTAHGWSTRSRVPARGRFASASSYHYHTSTHKKRHQPTTPSHARSDEAMTPAGACQRVRTGEGGGGFPIPNLPSRAVPSLSPKRGSAPSHFLHLHFTWPTSWVSLSRSLPWSPLSSSLHYYSACTAPRRAAPSGPPPPKP